MSVNIGEVTTFPHPKRDQEQMNKILEEVNELFVEWRKVDKCGCDVSHHCPNVDRLIEEAADTIEAICNLLAALGVDDMREAMHACEERNRERGRL
jgi:NTP pyrophosphatase (non-canonical NTP hydrolase)